MSQGRGDLGPGSYSLLWFLHSKLRFKRPRLSLQFMAEFEKKTITDHDFPPPLKMWGRKIKSNCSFCPTPP